MSGRFKFSDELAAGVTGLREGFNPSGFISDDGFPSFSDNFCAIPAGLSIAAIAFGNGVIPAATGLDASDAWVFISDSF